MNGDPLMSQLRQFAEKLAGKNIRLVIGGGYGLLLKANHIQRIGARTRLEQIPIARSTGDIDVFLTTEVTTDKNNMAAIRQALDELDYSPVPNATDFAIIIWLGQSLVNAAASPSLLRGFPPELAAELTWGVQQSELAATNGEELVAMMAGLIADPDYRKSADASIADIQTQTPEAQSEDYEEAGEDEVRYARAMWDENFEYAMEIAHRIADNLNSPEMSGYRAWWWYLGSIAASLMGDTNIEQDSLRRGASCGVNSGWLNRLLRQRKAGSSTNEGNIEQNAEVLWDLITRWGWAGPSFEEQLSRMLDQLKDENHVSYHQGLETLGKCFGAKTTRTTEPGAPDVVWSFPEALHVAFEAKTEKKETSLSKKEVQNAKGHIDWVKANLSEEESTDVEAIVVAPSPSLDQWALPFAAGIFYIAPEELLELAARVAQGVRKLRIQFAGQEFPMVAMKFSAEMRSLGSDAESVKKTLLTAPLIAKST